MLLCPRAAAATVALGGSIRFHGEVQVHSASERREAKKKGWCADSGENFETSLDAACACRTH